MGKTIPTSLAVTAALAVGAPAAGPASAQSSYAPLDAGGSAGVRTRPAKGRPAPHAHSDRVLKATDTAHLHYISASGSLLYEIGRATGTLPGSMQVHLLVGATFSGSFTIHVNGGSIRGRGSATPKGSGVYESFAGSLTVTGGSGRYRHAHGTAKLFGTFNRNTYALVIQTVGALRY